jgi:hypothetical protein
MIQKKARYPFKDEAERRLTHKVDIPVPGNGLGRDLTAMLEWCHARVPRPGWEYHGHTTRASKGGTTAAISHYSATALNLLLDLLFHGRRKNA